MRFSEDEDVVRDLVHPEGDIVVETVIDVLACVRRTTWGMLYADKAGIVSKSAEGLAKMTMTCFL